ncbi:NADPH-dependent FMN reductase [Sphingomonas sp. Ant H11]|uniref:NADPH-dependent FMN reductase n=1 Tax=Sphingomonas sp. Ant H11 TaxID=1564113 RepID=UPI0022B130F5|nr:NAD(P)H-dependent oxidoreductase [Sphingomonas sp. Ant H11]
MDDEAEMPQRASYASALTLEWSRKIASAAAFIFVTPQYNWGYPAALKKTRSTTSTANGPTSRS